MGLGGGQYRYLESFKNMHVAYRTFYISLGCVFSGLLCYCVVTAGEIAYLLESTLDTMKEVSEWNRL